MKEMQQVNNSYTNWLWSYGKQALKGVSVMGLGVLGYIGLRNYWSQSLVSRSPSSETTGLVSADTTAATVINQNPTAAIAPSTTVKNIWKTSDQTLQYRHKRSLVPLSDDFVVNTVTNNTQEKPAIASLNNGEFVVTWTSMQQDGSAYGVYARRFSSSGFPIVPMGAAFQVNTYTTANQQQSVLAGLSNGNFIISWVSEGQDGSGHGIFAKMFAANGTQLSQEIQVNNNTIDDQFGVAMTSLSNDNFVITWFSWGQDGSERGIFAQLFNANGTKIGNEFQVNNYTLNSQMNPTIARLNNSEFVISWHSSGQDGSGFGIYAQRFFNNATKINGEFQVNTYTLNDQASPAIAGLANGDFVITWDGSGQDDDSGVYAQRFSANGTKLGDQFLVNTHLLGVQFLPDIAALANGDFVIVWSGIGADDYGIHAQRFSANALPINTQFRVNNFRIGNQQNSVIASLGYNEFVVAWEGFGQDDDYGIYARWFVVSYSPSSLFRNQLEIGQGQTITIGQNQLLAVTENVPLVNLVLIANNISHGYFAKLDNPFLPISNFTQLDINNGQIQFTQDDSYEQPNYKIVVDDGFNATTAATVTMDFNRKPIWLKQQFSIANRREMLLSPNELLAIDDRYNSQVFFEVRNVSHGIFSLSNDDDSLDSFTQQQVNASTIKFVHNGSNLAPSFEIRASDGRLYTSYQTSQINFTLNRAPLLTRNRLTITQGERHILNIEELAATDVDELTTSELGQLLFNFTAVQRGQFSLSTNPTIAIFSAYQSQVAAGQLLFQHDGSEISPSYNVTVSDGFAMTESQSANISFSLNSFNPQAQVIRDNTNAAIGGAIGGVGGALLLAGIGIFGVYRYRRNKTLAEERSNSPLANALYEELKIAGTEDFQSRKGVEFVNAVNALNNELIRMKIDSQQMIPEELNELARKLANGARAQLGKNVNPLNLQDYAQEIVNTAMTLSGKKKTSDDVLVEMDSMPTSVGKKLLQDTFSELLQKKDFDMQTLSPQQTKMLAEKLIKTLEENLNQPEESTSSISQPGKNWRPGSVSGN